MRSLFLVPALAAALLAQKTAPLPQGELPNGWKLSPVGKQIRSEDMPLGLTFAPDGKAMVALHSGFNAHGLVVVDAYTDEATQRLPMKSA
ncbi:MAG: hypothetical protein NW208_18460, partial [Bryobacter sp.]|nr:hypothetical protein [Bryobacter sp.]